MKMKVDIKFIYQLLAHISVLECGDEESGEIKNLILPFAKKSHRWGDLNL
jgi:hypothetical protein